MATSGQHVGGLRDALVEDADLTAARRNQQVLAAAVKPRSLSRDRHDIGDGDYCPMGHGRMFVLSDSHPKRQYCSNQVHDGSPGTRAFWPFDMFEEAVKAYNAVTTKAASEPSALPILDITLEV